MAYEQRIPFAALGKGLTVLLAVLLTTALLTTALLTG